MSRATAQAASRALHLVSASSRCEGAIAMPSVSGQWLRFVTLSLALTMVLPYSLGPVMHSYYQLVNASSVHFLFADITVEVFQSTGAETPLTTRAQPSWAPRPTIWRCEPKSNAVSHALSPIMPQI